MSQETLAHTANVSVDTVARIERGERTFTRPATVAKLAGALGVTEEALLGVHVPRHDQSGPATAQLRRAITATSSIPGLDFTDDREVCSLAELERTTHQAWAAYVDGRHGVLMHSLPALLADANRLVYADGKGQRYLSTAYRIAAGLAGRLNMVDLAWTAGERALRAARTCDQVDLQTAVSLRYLTWVLLKQGRAPEAEKVAVAAAEAVEPRMFDRDSTRSGIFGNLLFNAAVAASRAGSSGRAEDILAVAKSAALRSACDQATELAIFGPRVAAIQEVEHAVRAGDPETAVRLSVALQTVQGSVPAFWEAGHHIHVAHALVQLKECKRALRHLTLARDLTPDWVRNQPLGVAVMRDLVDHAS